MILPVAATALLWWNENDSAETQRGISEIRQTVVPVGNSAVADAGLEGKTVFVTGKTSSDGTLSDSEFGVSAPGALFLEKRAEMYQWQEKKETKRHDNADGSQTSVTDYRYSKVWSASRLNSSNFKDRSRVNPESPVELGTSVRNAGAASVGAYALSPELVAAASFPKAPAAVTKVPGRTAASLSGSISALPAVPAGPVGWSVGTSGTDAYFGANPSGPEIGDVRVSFSAAPSGTDASAIGTLRGGVLSPVRTSNGKVFPLAAAKATDAEGLIASEESSGAVKTNVFRAVGFFLFFAGFLFLFGPILSVLSIVPGAGSLASLGATLVSFVLAFVCAATVVAVAWSASRPLFSVALVALSAAAFFVVPRFLPKKAAAAPADSDSGAGVVPVGVASDRT